MQTTPVAKGATVRATLDWLAAAGHETVLAAALAARPDAGASWQRLEPTAEVPYDDLVALWREIDHRLALVDPQWVERAGAHSIASVGQQLYSGILKKRSPTEFLTQSVSLFRLFYQPGNMEVVADDPGHAILRLVGFDARHPVFCRRLTGGLAEALAIAGGESPRVRHVRCALDGDAFCEWALTWR